jgi:hypothetical protein
MFMSALAKVKDYSNLIQEFAMYLKENKSYWLAPVIFVCLLLSALAFFLEGSVLAPAIYSIF